jgi:type IV secretion system protein VirB9
MNRIPSALVLAVIATIAAADPAAVLTPLVSADPPRLPAKPDDLYFSGPDPLLTDQEEAALAIAEKWQGGDAKSVAVSATNGVIKYKYGVQQPSIVCAVLQVCDIALQQGERISAINLGDTVRWTVEPAIAGEGDSAVQHVVVKPLDVGLETSLVVATDRRIYHMRLRSDRTRYMPQVAFSYTDGIGLGKRKPKPPKESKTVLPQGVATAPVASGPPALPSTVAPSPEPEYLSNINFNYVITGTAAWKPVRAYNDGKKTYLHMPSAASMTQGEAPSLLILSADSAGKDAAPVSYRMEGDSYVVDSVFDKAILVAGTGAAQERVTIERGR